MRFVKIFLICIIFYGLYTNYTHPMVKKLILEKVKYEILEKKYNQLILILKKYQSLNKKNILLIDEYKKKSLEHEKYKQVLHIIHKENREQTFWEWYHYSDKLSAKEFRKEFNRAIQLFIKTCLDQKSPSGTFVEKITVKPNAKIAIHGDIHGDKVSLFKYIKELSKIGYLSNKNPFKIIQNNFYLAFLGDYTDRGPDGLEVLYTIMRLKIENPEHVILLRGNHEDIKMNERYGFEKEAETKLNCKGCIYKMQIKKVYDCMPLAVYIHVKDTADYILLCHGGLEPRFNPHKLLSKKKKPTYFNNILHSNIKSEALSFFDVTFPKDKEKKFYKIKELDISWLKTELLKILSLSKIKMQKKVYNPQVEQFGFLWNDFIIDEKIDASMSKRGGYALNFGKQFTEKFIRSCSKEKEYELKAIIKSHQHTKKLIPIMVKAHGIYQFWAEKQWDGDSKTNLPIPKNSVWILNVSPGNYYGKKYKYNFDTYAILNLKKESTLWTLSPKKIIIKKYKYSL